MPGLPEAVVVNTADVVAKVIDGEVIIMNVRSGVYYSMNGPGVFVWERLTSGAPLAEIPAAVEREYAVSATHARGDVEALVNTCIAEGILQPSPAGASASPVSPSPERIPRQPYVAPVLDIYRDMIDLLAIDPPAPSFSDLQWKD